MPGNECTACKLCASLDPTFFVFLFFKNLWSIHCLSAMAIIYTYSSLCVFLVEKMYNLYFVSVISHPVHRICFGGFSLDFFLNKSSFCKIYEVEM